jgi:hypothetical protein
MKKLQKLLVILLVVGLVFGLAGCPDDEEGDFDKFYDGTFRNNQNGATEVVNGTAHNMLLFQGEVLIQGNIVGAVRAGERANINFSSENDFQVGGYKLIRAVRESEFRSAGDLARVDHSALVTYGEGRRFTTTITSTTDGQFQYTVNNRSRDYGLELRENSPEGRKVAYLTKGEVRRIIRTPTSTELTLYPVWVAFNNQTKTIVTFTPSDTLAAVDVQPLRANEDPSPYYFPVAGGTGIIQFPNVQLPFATIVIRNNGGLLANFRNGNQVRTAESGYTGISSGRMETYEIQGGGDMNLNLAMSQQQTVVPIRLESAPGAASVNIVNGRWYTVALTLTGSDQANPAHYTAWLKDEGEISTGDLLISH